MPRSKDTAAIVTYGDHEIITPENNLRGAVSKASSQSDDDPIARAEKALADLSNQFASWMDAECDRLDFEPCTQVADVARGSGAREPERRHVHRDLHRAASHAARCARPFASQVNDRACSSG